MPRGYNNWNVEGQALYYHSIDSQHRRLDILPDMKTDRKQHNKQVQMKTEAETEEVVQRHKAKLERILTLRHMQLLACEGKETTFFKMHHKTFTSAVELPMLSLTSYVVIT